MLNSGLKVTGNGTVRIQNCVINGTVEGTGADDTVVFQLDSVVGGLQGVENVHFGRQCDNLNLTGTAEFYNIYNENDGTDNDLDYIIDEKYEEIGRNDSFVLMKRK